MLVYLGHGKPNLKAFMTSEEPYQLGSIAQLAMRPTADVGVASSN